MVTSGNAQKTESNLQVVWLNLLTFMFNELVIYNATNKTDTHFLQSLVYFPGQQYLFVFQLSTNIVCILRWSCLK